MEIFTTLRSFFIDTLGGQATVCLAEKRIQKKDDESKLRAEKPVRWPGFSDLIFDKL